MLKRLENVFQDEKFFFESALITEQQKVPRDIFIYNIQKFKLLA